MKNIYESEKLLGEYLWFHYSGLPHPLAPPEALEFPRRCVTECVDASSLGRETSALDLGCAVGRSSFELARICGSVTGIDSSSRFIEAANQLQQIARIDYSIAEEGDVASEETAEVSPEIDRSRVRFMTGDALDLPRDLGVFDVVLMANLIDRLSEPKRCLERLRDLVRGGGQLVITSPYTWLEEFTPKAEWLARNGARTLETLQRELEPHFSLERTLELPFLIREHARKYQWTVAEASIWRRRR